MTYDAEHPDPHLAGPGVHDVLRHHTVGLTGFEPAASSSRTRRATKLRHSPPPGPRFQSGQRGRAYRSGRGLLKSPRPGGPGQGPAQGPAQELAQPRRVRVRWVTPLGEDTASMSKLSSSASRPSHSRV